MANKYSKVSMRRMNEYKHTCYMGCTKLIEGLQEQLSKSTVATPASLAGTLGVSSVDVPSTMWKASAELSVSAPVGRFLPDAACKPASKLGRVQDAR